MYCEDDDRSLIFAQTFALRPRLVVIGMVPPADGLRRRPYFRRVAVDRRRLVDLLLVLLMSMLVPVLMQIVLLVVLLYVSVFDLRTCVWQEEIRVGQDLR